MESEMTDEEQEVANVALLLFLQYCRDHSSGYEEGMAEMRQSMNEIGFDVRWQDGKACLVKKEVKE